MKKFIEAHRIAQQQTRLAQQFARLQPSTIEKAAAEKMAIEKLALEKAAAMGITFEAPPPDFTLESCVADARVPITQTTEDVVADWATGLAARVRTE